MTVSRKVLGAVAALTILAALVGASPVTAHEQAVLDNDDSDGPLDIVAARQRHARVTELQAHPEKEIRYVELRYRLVTYEKWERSIVSGGHSFISFEFNLDRDRAVERCLVVTNSEHEMLGRIYKNCTYFDDELIGSASVGRRDKHSLDVAFPRHILGKGNNKWRWRAATSFQEQNQNSVCPAPEPHGDGGYGACTDFTKWDRHSF